MWTTDRPQPSTRDLRPGQVVLRGYLGSPSTTRQLWFPSRSGSPGTASAPGTRSLRSRRCCVLGWETCRGTDVRPAFRWLGWVRRRRRPGEASRAGWRWAGSGRGADSGRTSVLGWVGPVPLAKMLRYLAEQGIGEDGCGRW